MARSVVRRRTLLAAAVALLGANGCAPRQTRPQPAPGPRITLFINSPWVYPLKYVLTRAWTATKPAFDVAFRTTGGPVPSADSGDLLHVEDARLPPPARVAVLPLRPYLQETNVDTAKLLPGSLAALTDPQGQLVALPIVLGQLQFYVSSARLAAMGVREPARWTWDEMLTVVAAVPPGTTPLVASGEWGQPNFWGAFVVGSGGSLLGPTQRIDLSGAVQATKRLLDVARALRWPPTQVDPGASVGLVTDGFAGKAAGALFAFSQPWVTAVVGSTPKCALCEMVPRQFPASPVRDAVPAFMVSGLGISSQSQHPDLAAQFLFWLLQPAQQRLLAAQGFPPAVQTAELQTYWRQVTLRNTSLPRFDPKGYFDAASYLPPVIVRAGNAPVTNQYRIALQQAFASMWTGADVATELAQAQQALEAGEAAYQAAYH